MYFVLMDTSLDIKVKPTLPPPGGGVNTWDQNLINEGVARRRRTSNA
jgi:hypothetical protein